MKDFWIFLSKKKEEEERSGLIPARLPSVSEFIQHDLKVFRKIQDGVSAA